MAENIDQYWSMTEGVFNCLIDKKRSLAFKKAIQRTVKKGDVVVDMGTGSGVLAMFAAKAGASKVYAVEIDKNNIKTLRQTFEQNSLSDKIQVVEGDITKIRLPEKVDVVIGEMIATALIEELQVIAMNNILRSAKDNCRVILSTYETFADLVFNQEKYYNCNFKILRYEYPDTKELESNSVTRKVLIDKSDFSVIRKNLKVNTTIDLKVSRDGIINGIRLSGQTTFFDGSKLGSTFAYSYPLILPIENTKVSKGGVFTLKIEYTISGGLQSLSYNLTKAN